MTQDGVQSLPEVSGTLVERCRVLQLALWPRAADGGVHPQPLGHAEALPWLRSGRLHFLVERCVQAWEESAEEAQPVRLFESCWLIPVRWGSWGRVTTTLPVLALAAAAIESDEFDAVSLAAGLEPDEGRQVVASMLQPAEPDPRQLRTIVQWSSDDLREAERCEIALDSFSEKLIQSYEEASGIYRMARLLNVSESAYRGFDGVCRQIEQILPFKWVAARFVGVTKVKELAGQLIVSGELPCSREMFNQAASDLLRQWNKGIPNRVLTPADSKMADLVGSEVVAERFSHRDHTVGVLLAGNKPGPDSDVTSNETQFLDAAADFLTVFYENLTRFEEQHEMMIGTLQALTASIDAKDRYTCGHSERVALLASQLALVIGLDDEEIEQIRIAGLVHDVGKIGVPEAVLCKPGKLTHDEFSQMKQHPVIGHEILKDIPPLTNMLPGVLHHHERWDGLGYPHGLKGMDIPLFGRILACADTFDAMSSTRSYRPALPRHKVLAEFDTCAGSQFDPDLAHSFVMLDLSQYDAMADRHRAASATFAA
jgi:hypothetical protein